MSHYQHTKGQIKDNAIEALLHDPLFRQRVEKNKKGREVICVKTNMQNGVTGRPVASKRIAYLPLAFLLLAVKRGYSALLTDREFQSVILLLS